MDSTVWKILRELQYDARISFNALRQHADLSTPDVAERVRKVERGWYSDGPKSLVFWPSQGSQG
ncbi:AsnC family transcriptional regulator [Thermosporothrix hazakensis]|uniref:AsnC family transcriptional regulator n=1 Tax=Thermosporothrix hazakensis TaxID=644383 RepID=UPI000DAD7381|nr:Lrp/AsnC family transcriptional regulator [Thermosporothrix hazakensis]